MQNLPLIDVSALHAGDPASAASLRMACREIGFFYVTGHSIPPALTTGIFDAAHRFFAQPDAAKQTLSIKRSPHNRGYVAPGAERLDEATPPDWKEAFNIGLELPPDDAELAAGKAFRGVNFWPDLPGWRDTVLAYYDACHQLVIDIHKGFARDLGIAEDFFTPLFDRPISTLRLLRYPPGGSNLGAGTHTDYGNLTILATDGVAGLQVRQRDGTWLDAPHIDGAFVCNIGDCLMRWTNDVYVSTPHRVVSPRRERFSVAFFADANPDAVVRALPTCVPDGQAPRYAPITAGAYLAMRLDATYDHRKATAAG
jgi:isopenicillin N synthase-like dioxygenase